MANIQTFINNLLGVGTPKVSKANHKVLAEKFLSYEEQTLTDSQILQFKENIKESNPTIEYNISEKSIPILGTSSAITKDYIISGEGNNFVKWNEIEGKTILLSITGVSEWRCMFKDSIGNVFASPMDSYSASIATLDHALYKFDGSSVTKVIQLSDRECIWGIDEDANGNIFALVYSLSGTANANLYKSTNGTDFQIIFDGDSWTHGHALSVDKSNNYVYATFGDGTGNKTYRSIDGGLNWTNIITTATPNQFTSILCTENYRFFGSDFSPYGTITRTANDVDTEVVLSTHYQNCFFLKQSDVTGWIYAGFKLDPTATINLRSDIYVSKDEGDTWELYLTINNIVAGNGFWFASNFYNGNLAISIKSGSDYIDSVVVSEIDFAINNNKQISQSRTLNNFDNNKILEIIDNVILTIPSSGIIDNFRCKIDVISGSVKFIADGGGVSLDFPDGYSLGLNSQGEIYKRKFMNTFRGIGDFSYLYEYFNAPFDSDVNSIVGGFTGTGTDISFVSGKLTNAVELNGSTSKIDYADNDFYSFCNNAGDLPFSISFWINFDSISDVRVIANKQEINIREYLVAYSSGVLTCILTSPDNSKLIRANYTWTPIVGTWYHVVITYDGSKNETGIKIYVDGTLKTTTNTKIGLYNGMTKGISKFSIGYNHRTNSEFFDGKLDEFTIAKNKEYSLAEIQNIYNSGNGKTYPY